METAYLSHELSAGSKQTLFGGVTGLPSVETVDQLDKDVRKSANSKTEESGSKSNKLIESDSVMENEKTVASAKEDKKGDSKVKSTKQKFPFSAHELDLALQKTNEVVQRLHTCDDFTSNKYAEEFEYLRQVAMLSNEFSAMKHACFDAMVNNNVTQIFTKVMGQALKLPFDQPDYEATYVNIRAVLVAHWNGTDANEKFCTKVMENGVYVNILTYLNSDVLKTQDQESIRKVYVVKGLLGILHNLCQRSSKSRALLRENNAVNIVKAYGNFKNTMVSCKSLMVLAHIINEEENEIINSDDQPIIFMLKILKDTLKNKEHISKKYGYRSTEILEVLNRLAVTDSNKMKMVKLGALEHYAKLLETSCSAKEQALSAKGLWTLAFKAKDAILTDKDCMKGLNRLLQHSNDKNVLSQVKGALWILESKNQNEGNRKNRNSYSLPTEEIADGSHIMISYQWDNKSTMIRIKDCLKESGHKVWMDEDDMEGNILDGMADAIEKARVVLVCMSQKYKDSPNCRTEAEYAYKLRKKIVPLKLQYKYDPDGWLGIIVGTKLYFDFSEESRYDKSLTNLMKELSFPQQSQAVTPAYVGETMTHAPRTTVVAKNDAEQWNQGKVIAWLEQNGLAKYKEKFSEFDGVLLIEYKMMMKSAPDFFFTTLRDTMKLPLVDILRFSSSLRKI